jgi:hypothetical protein
VFIQTIFRARNGNGTSHDFRLDFRSDEKDQCFSKNEKEVRFSSPIRFSLTARNYQNKELIEVISRTGDISLLQISISLTTSSRQLGGQDYEEVVVGLHFSMIS